MDIIDDAIARLIGSFPHFVQTMLYDVLATIDSDKFGVVIRLCCKHG